jgi:uncharacterized protein (UPF0333 family)
LKVGLAGWYFLLLLLLLLLVFVLVVLYVADCSTQAKTAWQGAHSAARMLSRKSS